MKEKTKRIIQRSYELFCAVFCILILTGSVEDSIAWRMLILTLPFAGIALLKKETIKRISFGIFLGLLSYAAWTVVITVGLTDLLDTMFGLPEHSMWDIFAFLLPLIFAATTLIWAVRDRAVSDKFDRLYLSLIVGVLFICAMCQCAS